MSSTPTTRRCGPALSAAAQEPTDSTSAHVAPPDVTGAVLVSNDLAQHAAWLNEYTELGFDEIYVHHVGQEQRGFLDAFGEHVLPQLSVTAPPPAVAL